MRAMVVVYSDDKKMVYPGINHQYDLVTTNESSTGIVPVISKLCGRPPVFIGAGD